jgi:hypothetical protein
MHCYSNLGVLLQQQAWQACSVHGELFGGGNIEACTATVGNCLLAVSANCPSLLSYTQFQFALCGVLCTSMAASARSCANFAIVSGCFQLNLAVRSVAFCAVPRRRVPAYALTACVVPGLTQSHCAFCGVLCSSTAASAHTPTRGY